MSSAALDAAGRLRQRPARRVKRPLQRNVSWRTSGRFAHLRHALYTGELAFLNHLNENNLVAFRIDGLCGLDEAVVIDFADGDANRRASRPLNIDTLYTNDHGRLAGRLRIKRNLNPCIFGQ